MTLFRFVLIAFVTVGMAAIAIHEIRTNDSTKWGWTSLFFFWSAVVLISEFYPHG